MYELLERPAEPLVAGKAGDRLERRVEGGDRAVGGEREDDIAHAVDQGTVPRFALPQLLLRARLLRAGAVQVQRAQDGRAEALEVRLDDVIRRAGLDVVRRGLFVEAPGHNDDGDAGALSLSHLDCLAGAEARQGVVGDDQVGRELMQRAEVVGPGIYALERATDSRAPQLTRYQLGVGRDILDEEDAGGRGAGGFGPHVSAPGYRSRRGQDVAAYPVLMTVWSSPFLGCFCGTRGRFCGTGGEPLWRRGDHADPNREPHEARDVVEVEALHHRRSMRLDGLYAELEPPRDLPGPVALGDEQQHLVVIVGPRRARFSLRT